MKNRIKSFSFAIAGLVTMFKEEPNAKIHLASAIVAIGLGWYLDVSIYEWIFIAIAIALVMGAELFNTSIECLSDAVTEEQNIHIKKVKDLAAGGVLVCAVTAMIIGLLVFLPKLLDKIFI